MRAKLKRLAELVESLMLGAKINPLERPLLVFPEGRKWLIRHAHQGVLMFGSPGRGKSTASLTLLRAFMLRRYGGLALVVKAEFVAEFLAVAKAAGRENDVIVLRHGDGRAFNPFADVRTPLDAATMIGEVSDAMASADGDSGIENAAEWKAHRKALLTNLCVVCLHLHGVISFRKLKELYDTVPYTPAGTLDPVWRRESPLGRVLDSVNAGMPSGVRDSLRFLTNKFPATPEKMQGSIRAMVDLALDPLCRSPLSEIFGENGVVSMEEVLNHRKMLLADLPSAGSEDGRCANVVLQYCYCRAAKSLKRHADSFLFSDECHYTAGREVIESLSLFRGYRVSAVMITQSVAILEQRVGKSGFKALCSPLETKIFLGQEDAETRDWMEKHIGKEWKWRRSRTDGDGRSSTTSVKELQDAVPAHEFAGMENGESVCSYGGKYWRVKWPLRPPSGGCPLHVPEWNPE